MTRDLDISHLDRKGRRDVGKALRKAIPCEVHADFRIDADRDPLPILAASDTRRLSWLVPKRYKRMAASPFAFYRGAAAMMAWDLKDTRRIGIPVQACGDCHLMNFGAFASPEGNVLFDINDFDETAAGVDFIVDLKRLVASVAVAAKDANLGDSKARNLAAATSKAYRDFMSYLAERSPLEVWQTRMDLKAQIEGLGDADLETEILESLAQAASKSKSSKETPEIETGSDGVRRFADRGSKVRHVGKDGVPAAATLTPEVIAAYAGTLLPERAILLARYRLADVAFKVVGVGSVGTFCAVVLLVSPDGDELVLQAKQALPSAIGGLAKGGGNAGPDGRRVVEGQRALQAASDVFLGWTQDSGGRQFYLRQLKNRRLDSIGAAIQAKALPAYAALCGRTLARAHARTGDAAAITGYVGASEALDDALASFAMSYASQTVLDHARLVASQPGKPEA